MSSWAQVAIPRTGRALRMYFVLALALVGLTLVLDRLQVLFGTVQLVPYLVLVALAARWGGLAAAIFTSLAAVPLVDFFLFDLPGQSELGSRRMLQLLLVLLAGLLLGWVMDGLRTARERSEAAAAAERAALQERDALLSVIAHDLRSPLTAIKARAQLASLALQRAPPDAPSARRSLDQVLPQVDRVNRLLDDLLATGRSDGGSLSVAPVELDLAPLVTRVAERWRTDAPSHPLELEVAEALPVMGDAGRLEQVLDNLLANAVKYSPDGSPIRLRARVEEREARVTVSDRGAGIPPVEQALLFDRFYRRPEHRVSRQPGLGLGLYITRELVQAQGGRVWVESEPGQGSTFVVTLPLRSDGQADGR